MNAADQAAQVLDRDLRLLVGLLEQGPGVVRVTLEPRPGDAEFERQRHEPGLQPVVQVPFDPPPLRFRGLDGVRPRLTQVLDFGGKLPGTARSEQRAGERHVERGPEPDHRRPHEDEDNADRHVQDVFGRVGIP